MPDIESLKKEYQELLTKLQDPELISDFQRFQELTKRKDFLEKIMEIQKEIEDCKNKMEENKAILSSGEDQELSSLAQTEIIQLETREKYLQEELARLFRQGEEEKEEEENDVSAVIVEIRAGTGGDEAALFAGDLYKMYSKYGQKQGWQQKILDSSPTEIGGFKEIVFELGGKNAFSQMKREAGVHRVQRIPTTEKTGRIHTSTASVAVLPKPRKTEIIIRPDDLKIDFYHSSGAGGQNVNKRMTAVRITHLPSGFVVTSQSERSQLQNRANAMAILEAKLLEKKETDANKKAGGERRSQIGGAERAEKIRTYNFPQDRITDHRIKKSFHNLEAIMEGNLEPILKQFQDL